MGYRYASNIKQNLPLGVQWTPSPTRSDGHGPHVNSDPFSLHDTPTHHYLCHVQGHTKLIWLCLAWNLYGYRSRYTGLICEEKRNFSCYLSKDTEHMCSYVSRSRYRLYLATEHLDICVEMQNLPMTFLKNTSSDTTQEEVMG